MKQYITQREQEISNIVVERAQSWGKEFMSDVLTSKDGLTDDTTIKNLLTQPDGGYDDSCRRDFLNNCEEKVFGSVSEEDLDHIDTIGQLIEKFITMDKPEIYKGWKISGAKDMVRRLFTDGHLFVAVKINDEASRRISSDSIELIKTEIDEITSQEKVENKDITWHLIEEMPDQLRDGRIVLLKYDLGDLSDIHERVIIGHWREDLKVWVWQQRAYRAYSDVYQPTHYAEINLPE